MPSLKPGQVKIWLCLLHLLPGFVSIFRLPSWSKILFSPSYLQTYTVSWVVSPCFACDLIRLVYYRQTRPWESWRCHSWEPSLKKLKMSFLGKCEILKLVATLLNLIFLFWIMWFLMLRLILLHDVCPARPHWLTGYCMWTYCCYYYETKQRNVPIGITSRWGHNGVWCKDTGPYSKIRTEPKLQIFRKAVLLIAYSASRWHSAFTCSRNNLPWSPRDLQEKWVTQRRQRWRFDRLINPARYKVLPAFPSVIPSK